MNEETRTPAGIAPDGSVVFQPKFAPDDLVRLIGVEPGSMIESYLGYEGRVVDKHPQLPLYTVELDVGRRNYDRGGQLGPRFIVAEKYLDPDVTEKMLEAGDRIFEEIAPEALVGEERRALLHDIYRAMRAARFER